MPFVLQTLLAMKDAMVSPKGYLPFGIMMTLTLLSFGENIEIAAYLLWPALIVLGNHARELQNQQDQANLSAAVAAFAADLGAVSISGKLVYGDRNDCAQLSQKGQFRAHSCGNTLSRNSLKM